MMRYSSQFGKLKSGLAAGLGVSAAAQGAQMGAISERPNIVLMVSDDHGIEALGCYGNPVIRTPHLDKLAADGTRFTRAFCTAASCSPSRAAILTGLQSHTSGTYGLTHSIHHFSCLDNVKTLPAFLLEAGYRTGRIGKEHYAPRSLFPFQFGPDEMIYGHDDVRMSQDCRAFIEQEEPFFLYWCSRNPHRDGRALESHPCKPNRFGNPDTNFPGDQENSYSDDEVIVPPFLSDTPEARAELAQYYQSISRLDRGIGRLTDLLKAAGKYDNTLIIYLSDNGSAFPGSKTTLYDPGMRLPCIVKRPAEKHPGTVNDGLISWVDITPTILDFAGIPVAPDAFHGKSFRPLVGTAASNGWREEIFASHAFHEVINYYPMRVIRTQKYKFIWNIAYPLTYPFSSDLWKSAVWSAVRRDRPQYFGARKVEDYLHRPQFELYDLETDPNEAVNLAGNPEYKAIVENFCDKLKAFQQQTSDPWRSKWQYE
jgi:N-sulfoglucosamine sulfohydrolase